MEKLIRSRKCYAIIQKANVSEDGDIVDAKMVESSSGKKRLEKLFKNLGLDKDLFFIDEITIDPDGTWYTD